MTDEALSLVMVDWRPQTGRRPLTARGKRAIENMNKILREFFPKGTDFRVVSQAQLDRVQYQINERPRKKLGFSIPKIEFFRKIS